MRKIISFLKKALKGDSRGVTLIEILIVLIIVGILASFAFPGYIKMRETAVDKEVKSALKLVQSAQKIYRLERPYFYGDASSGCTTDKSSEINTILHLDLVNSNWNYCVDISDPATHADYTARGTRKSGTARTWRIGSKDQEASCTGATCL